MLPFKKTQNEKIKFTLPLQFGHDALVFLATKMKLEAQRQHRAGAAGAAITTLNPYLAH
ncbi:MAG: hypothetical protein IPM82_16430 [Saprospiraceae bacterium]|nr:hypothetical protein [Saprospiraceae bacterium]